MSKPWVHEDCLELVTNLADMNCTAWISDGILTLEDGTQVDLLLMAKKECKEMSLDEALGVLVDEASTSKNPQVLLAENIVSSWMVRHLASKGYAHEDNPQVSSKDKTLFRCTDGYREIKDE